MALFINKWECIFLPVAKTSTELCLATSPGVKDLFFINSIINLILGTRLCRGKRVCAGYDTSNCAAACFTQCAGCTQDSTHGQGPRGRLRSPRVLGAAPELSPSSRPPLLPGHQSLCHPGPSGHSWGCWERPWGRGQVDLRGSIVASVRVCSWSRLWAIRALRTPRLPHLRAKGALPHRLTPPHHPPRCRRSHRHREGPPSPLCLPGRPQCWRAAARSTSVCSPPREMHWAGSCWVLFPSPFTYSFIFQKALG